MKRIEKFEDLEVWQEGMRLVVEIYQQFKKIKDYGFRDQIQRAAVSIPSNIAEGFDRGSNKEYIHFLYIARGSCAELRTQLYLALKVGFINKSNTLELGRKTE
ncbi:MAG: four helix bundle protein [Candidatus Cloacimonetes bacterium]|nr:four helix bundle protein [Candidatus Cloacimonadota bacterium]